MSRVISRLPHVGMAPRPSDLPAYRRPPPRRGGHGSFGPKIPPAPTRGEPSRTLAFASGDLRAAIGQNPDDRKALIGAEIVTLSIGGNDLFQAEQVWLSGACEDGACYDEALADFDETGRRSSRRSWSYGSQARRCSASRTPTTRSSQRIKPYSARQRLALQSKENHGNACNTEG